MPDLSHVQTWLYHLGDVNKARATEIGATNADMVVTEWASYARDEAPYTPAQLDRMRGEDADRLMLSYLSIGEAETYRYYWDTDWESTSPAWIGEVNPEWTDNVKVRYWDPDWQAIIFDYVDRIVDGGFDGVYLDIVGAYQYWGRNNRAPGIDTETEMIDFIAAIRERAETRLANIDPGRDFHIIGQNALELVRNPDYRDAVDGVASEDARFYYRNGRPQDFRAWPEDEFDYVLNLMNRAERSGLSAFAVEYIPPGEVSGVSSLLAAEAQALGQAGIPLYRADHRDLDTIPAQPDELENGVFPRLGPYDGGGGPEPITGTNRADTLDGTGGDDVILGRGGRDEIDGRAGDDSLEGGGGGDDLTGGRGADTLDGGGGQDNLFGGGGKDTLFGGAKADLLRGQAGGDRLFGGAGPDDLYGGGGRDVIAGGGGGDLLYGGGGPDRFVFQPGDGEDQIRDLDPLRDRVDLPDGATPDISFERNGVYVGYGPGDGVLLRGLDRADFDADVLLI